MLLIGDCFKKIDEIDRKSVQAIVTSPPYWGLRDYQKDGQLGEEPTPEDFVQKLTLLFNKCKRVLKDDGTLGVNIGDTYFGAKGGHWDGGNSITNDGTANFSTSVETTAAEDVSGLSTAIIGGTSALDNGSGGSAVCAKKFAVGDIIHAEDDIILGEIASLTTNTLTFRHDGVKQYHAGGEVLYNTPSSLEDWKIQNGADAAGDLADGDELYNAHPITVRLSFER